MTHDPTTLPPNLPVPTDDGACLHLRGKALPDLSLLATDGSSVSLRAIHNARPSDCASEPKDHGLEARATVLFFYPRTGVPGQPPTLGFSGEEWDSIPGARGCTPHSCGFRDLYAEFQALGVAVFGVSTNTTEHQREFRERNRVPFHFLSDADLHLTRALNLPTFEFPIESGGPTTLVKRMAWYISADQRGTPRIRKVWYPVFPPDRNAQTILDWLRRRAAVTIRVIEPRDADFIREELTRHWASTGIWSLGRMYHADQLPGFIAEFDNNPAGLLTYHIQPGGFQSEVVTVSSRREDSGIATRLLEAAEDAARAARCNRIFLTTTNDNTRALGFYQSRGWSLAALHKGLIDEARKRVPHIPRIGQRGIPIRDEIELELWL